MHISRSFQNQSISHLCNGISLWTDMWKCYTWNTNILTTYKCMNTCTHNFQDAYSDRWEKLKIVSSSRSCNSIRSYSIYKLTLIYCMAGNIGVELNLAVGKINCLLPNFTNQHFNKLEAPTYAYTYSSTFSTVHH